MEKVLDWLNGSLRDIECDAFKDVIKVEDASWEPTGDGQVVVISDIKRITLSLTSSSGEKRRLKAIAKLEAATPAGKDIADMCGAFNVETLMYVKVLKDMEKLISEVGNKEHLWAKCYHHGDNKLLFQDLCEVGYKIVPTHRFLDVDHTLLVMEAIGKFHGLSLVLKERGELDTTQMIAPYYARNLPFVDFMFVKIVEKFIQSIKDHWGPEWSSLPDRLEKYLENTSDKLKNAWESTRGGKCDVLNHGDFSMRNMLFHYGPDSEKPDHVKFVDFQMCHFSSCANDLVMLLYSSVLPTVRDPNMKLFLQTYIRSLTSTVKLFGYGGKLPSMSDIEESLRGLNPFIVTTVMMNIPMFINSGKIDLQEKADEYMNKYDNFDDAMKSTEDDSMSHLNFGDEDVIKMMKIEFKRFCDEKIF